MMLFTSLFMKMKYDVQTNKIKNAIIHLHRKASPANSPILIAKVISERISVIEIYTANWNKK